MRDEFGSKKQPTGDYEVGYAKPPESGRWQKGQSGNPKGRPKHKLITDLVEAYHEAGLEIVTVPIRGKPRRMTLVQAQAFKAQFDAASGDPRARRDVMRVDEIYAQRRSARADDGWTIIEARPVFDGEEDRGWNYLAKEKEALEELVEQLQAELAAREGPHLLPPPDSAENSA